MIENQGWAAGKILLPGFFYRKRGDYMSYRIALASSDGRHIDRHFGHSDGFVIVEVEPGGKFVEQERRQAQAPCQHGFHEEGAMQTAVRALRDCRYVVAEAIGPGAQKALEQQDILPLEIEGTTVADAVQKIYVYEKNKQRASVRA